MTGLANAIKYEVWYCEYLRLMEVSSLKDPCSRETYAARIRAYADINKRLGRIK